jgi:hypothetical protein
MRLSTTNYFAALAGMGARGCSLRRHNTARMT